MRIDHLSPARWKRIKAIADQVLDAESELERSGILDRECGQDSELRSAVSEVCSQFSDSQDLLGCPPVVIDSTDMSALQPGDVAGAYRVERELGRGGMGHVYLATRADDAYSKNVAIKTLSQGVEPQVLELFLNERRTLAVLDHPNITRILDAGTTTQGVPFVVMEFAEGRPITEQLKGHTEAEILRTFLQVCEALEHAHQHAILHCDLKPSNILVSGKGEVKVLDFGLSQVSGDRAKGLTANYASPEQKRGEPLTTRSDIYSLGVLLRELSGARPSADLEAILRKAAEPKPSTRYPSADALSADIRRFLNREPVEARNGGAGYRAKLYVQRHGWRVAGAAALAVTVILGLVGTISQKRAAERNFRDVRGLARTVIFDYQSELGKMQGSTALRARIAADTVQYLDKLAAESPADPVTMREIAVAYRMVAETQGYQHVPNIGNLKGAAESLGKSVTILSSIQTGDPALKRELSRSLERQANVFTLSGRNRDARAAALHSIELLTGMTDADTERSDAWRELSAALIGLGLTTEAVTAAQEATASGRKSKSRDSRALAFLQLSRATLMGIGPNPQSKDSAQAAVDEYKNCAVGDSACAAGYLTAMAALARHYAYSDESEAGVRVARQAEKAALEALAHDPNDRRLLRQLRYSQSLRGDNLRDLGRTVPARNLEALEKYRDAVQTAERMLQGDPQHPDAACQVIATKARYGEMLIEGFRRPDDADRQLKEAVRIADAQAHDNMQCLDSRKMAVINLARVEEARGNWEGGMEWRRETVRNALRYAKRSPGEPLSLVIEAGANYELGLGALAAAEHGRALGRLEEARRALIRALEIYRELKNMGNPIENQYRNWPGKTSALLIKVERKLASLSK